MHRTEPFVRSCAQFNFSSRSSGSDNLSKAKMALSVKSLCALVLSTSAEWGNPSAKDVFESGDFFLILAFKGSKLDMVWEQGWSSDVLVFPEWKHEKRSSRQNSALAAMWVRLWNILSNCCRISEIQAIKCCAILLSWQNTAKFTHCVELHIFCRLSHFTKLCRLANKKLQKKLQSKGPSVMSPLSSNTNKNSMTVPPQNPSAFERRPCSWKTVSKSLNPIQGERERGRQINCITEQTAQIKRHQTQKRDPLKISCQ